MGAVLLVPPSGTVGGPVTLEAGGDAGGEAGADQGAGLAGGNVGARQPGLGGQRLQLQPGEGEGVGPPAGQLDTH